MAVNLTEAARALGLVGEAPAGSRPEQGPADGVAAPAGHWIQTASGKVFVLDAPTAAMVSAADIGAALAKLCRFNGHTRGFYSVAQHSVLVALLAGEAAAEGDKLAAMRWGLLHDAHEAYLGDMTRPLKRAMGDAGERYTDLCRGVDWQVRQAFGLAALPELVAAVVKWADLRALAVERRSLMSSTVPWPETDAVEAVGVVACAVDWGHANRLWVEVFDALFRVHPATVAELWGLVEKMDARWYPAFVRTDVAQKGGG